MEHVKTSTKHTTQDEITVIAPEASKDAPQKEYGGVSGKEPTEYGDWQHKGRCTDF